MRSVILRPVLILCGGLATAACTQPDGSTALGVPGSPAWQATASPAAKMATYRTNCEGYGYVAGTPAMAQCMQQEAGDYRAGAAANMAALSTNMANMSQPRPMTTTNCTAIGHNVNCTSY